MEDIVIQVCYGIDKDAEICEAKRNYTNPIIKDYLDAPMFYNFYKKLSNSFHGVIIQPCTHNYLIGEDDSTLH